MGVRVGSFSVTLPSVQFHCILVACAHVVSMFWVHAVQDWLEFLFINIFQLLGIHQYEHMMLECVKRDGC